MSAYEYQVQRAHRAEAERDEFKRMYAELNGALCWDTTCLNCANLLDKSYADYVRADKAETALRQASDALASANARAERWKVRTEQARAELATLEKQIADLAGEVEVLGVIMGSQVAKVFRALLDLP